jgi:hypothetical protein
MARAFLNPGVDAGLAIPIAGLGEQLASSYSIAYGVFEEGRRPQRVREIERVWSAGAAKDGQRFRVAAIGIGQPRGAAVQIAEVADGVSQPKHIVYCTAETDRFFE